MTITAAADGSALGNPGPAGWAWYVDESTWACGGWARGTNNQGELTAVLDLLRQTAHTGEDLHVYCDSQYVINSVTKWMAGWKRKGWKKADGKPVLNVEIMKALDEAMAGRQVRFTWVKGHAGHALNEKADVLANGASQAYASKKRPEPGPGYPGAKARGASDDPAAPPPAGGGSTGVVSAVKGLGKASAGRPPAEPDLFSADDADPRDHSDPADDAAALVVDLERALLSDAVRGDRDRLDALLHPDFTEIGASGRLLSRAEVVDRTASVGGETTLEVLSTSRPGPDQVLLLWRSTEPTRRCVRSSLWVHDGRTWRLRFHQGTPEA